MTTNCISTDTLRRSICVHFFIALPLLLMSCTSTKVYTKEITQLYDNDMLIEETTSFVKTNKSGQKHELENTSKAYYSTVVDGINVSSTTETSSKSSYAKHTIQLFRDGKFIAEREFRTDSEGKLHVPSSTDDEEEEPTSASYDANTEALLQNAFDAVQNEINAKSSAENDNIKVFSNVEQVHVESSPNGKYIAYTIFAKPLLIGGVTVWNLLKCGGYALVNFAGGYSTVENGEFFWLMPDVKKSKEKAAAARAANGIKVYPEYHVPFTNNHIIVTTLQTETTGTSVESKENAVIVASKTEEFDQELNVQRSAAADAYSTASVAGFVGTVLSVPVSGLTFLAGAAFAAYAQSQ